MAILNLIDPTDKTKCPKCGHRLHGTWCPNMASDNDCDCEHDSSVECPWCAKSYIPEFEGQPACTPACYEAGQDL